MNQQSPDYRRLLERAADSSHHPEHRTADALAGLLAIIVDRTDHDDREERLREQLDELDATVGRLITLADWHDTKAEKATASPGSGELNEARMSKAAEVHRDASRRIREAIDGEGQ